LQTTLTEVIHRFLVFLLSNPPFYGALSPGGHASLLKLHDHTQTHHTRYDFSGRVIGPAQRSLPDNQQHLQETHTHIHGPCKIRTRISSKRAVADPSCRPRGHWDRLSTPNPFKSVLPIERLVNSVGWNRKVLRTEKRYVNEHIFYSVLVFSRLFPTAIMLLALFLGYSRS